MRISDFHLEVQTTSSMLTHLDSEQSIFDKAMALNFLSAKLSVQFLGGREKHLLDIQMSKVRILMVEPLGMREYTSDQNVGLSLAGQSSDLKSRKVKFDDSQLPEKTEPDNYKVERQEVKISHLTTANSEAMVFTPSFLTGGKSSAIRFLSIGM